MSPLNKKLLRDLVVNWPQVAAIVVVVALGIIMFAGPLMAQRDLSDSVGDVYRRTDYEDFSVRVDSAPLEAVSGVARLENISVVEGRISRESLASVEGHNMTLRVISVPDVGRLAVNGLILERGRYLEPADKPTCLVEHHLSAELGIGPGDVITLLRKGPDARLKVTGSVVSPEYLRLVSGPGEYVADPSQFGVIFVRYTDAERLFEMEGEVNDFVARTRDQDETRSTMVEAAALLSPYTVVGMTEGADEPSATLISFEIADVGKLAIFFAVLLLAVASLALYITMTQIVFSQQRQIGVTRAVGYPSAVIMRHYLGYGLVLGVFGSALGVVCGYYLSRVFIRIYAGIFDLPLVKVSMFWWIALAGVAVGVVFSVAGAVVPARHAVRMRPAEAMRTDAGLSLAPVRHKGRRSRAGHSAASWLRVSLANLFRNRRRTLLTFLGVIATLCLFVTASGGKDSLDHAVDKHLHGVLRWDVALVFSRPVGEDTLRRVEAMDGVKAAEPGIAVPATVSSGGDSLDVQLEALQGDSHMHGAYPTKGSKPRPGPGEIVLNRSITKKLKVEIGDTVKVGTALGSLDLEVAGFLAEPFGGVCYVDLDYVQRLAGADVFNMVLIKTRVGSESAVASEVISLPGAARVLTRKGVLSVFQELVGAVKTLFIIFYVMAFSMGFAILFSMVTVNLLERRREIATMRTLGTGRWRLFAFLTVETLAVVVAAIVPGLLLGRLLEWFVIEKLVSSDRLAPDTVITGATIALVVVAALAVSVISELPSVRKLWRMDLASVTKERAD